MEKSVPRADVCQFLRLRADFPARLCTQNDKVSTGRQRAQARLCGG